MYIVKDWPRRLELAEQCKNMGREEFERNYLIIESAESALGKGLMEAEARGEARGEMKILCSILAVHAPDCPEDFWKKVHESTDLAWMERTAKLALQCTEWEELKAKLLCKH